jgi:hypothetical protein
LGLLSSDINSAGIHVVLFCFCVKTLWHWRVRDRLALSVAISVIFLLCTLHCILQLINAGELLTILEKSKGHDHVARVKVNPALMKRWNQINIAMDSLYVTSK